MDWHNDFEGRVSFAARVISSGQSTSRTFDSCFENNDGDAVVVALHRRIKARPDTKLAQNIERYLCKASTASAVATLEHIATRDLPRYAAQLRANKGEHPAKLSPVVLAWHGMLCPSCFSSAYLDVAAAVRVRLTKDGSDSTAALETSHEWDDDSHCACANCGFSAPVHCFKSWDVAGGTISVTEKETSGADPCAFEIVLTGMVQDTSGDWINAEAIGKAPQHYDLQLLRTRNSTGEVAILQELSDLKEDEANRYTDDFAHDYPFAGFSA